MKKQNKTKSKPVRFELNGGNIVIEVDHRGAVYSVEENVVDWDEEEKDYEDVTMLELSATELDAIVLAARKAKELAGSLLSIIHREGVRKNTRANGYLVSFCGEDNINEPDMDCFGGGVNIGCQHIDAEDVLKIHAASLKARGLKAKKS